MLSAEDRSFIISKVPTHEEWLAEYALSDIDKPIGVAEYQLLRDFPESLGRNQPSSAEIEAELAGELDTGSEME
ncbi:MULTISPECIES: hypothetical protein [Pseudomonas]|uniref:hypothetical protein n=1 Tax=Pseudomonas sp. MIL9 TaxID=2807620 RepID=UPI001EF3B42E|nr:hypothetical protein [Pseudomonas sp. MIL9]